METLRLCRSQLVDGAGSRDAQSVVIQDGQVSRAEAIGGDGGGGGKRGGGGLHVGVVGGGVGAVGGNHGPDATDEGGIDQVI